MPPGLGGGGGGGGGGGDGGGGTSTSLDVVHAGGLLPVTVTDGAYDDDWACIPEDLAEAALRGGYDPLYPALGGGGGGGGELSKRTTNIAWFVTGAAGAGTIVALALARRSSRGSAKESAKAGPAAAGRGKRGGKRRRNKNAAAAPVDVDVEVVAKSDPEPEPPPEPEPEPEPDPAPAPPPVKPETLNPPEPLDASDKAALASRAANVGSAPTASGAVKVGRLLVGPKVLGYGGCGTIVFEGALDGRPVAVKRLLLQFYELARKELATLIASDEHPNVVRCYALEEDADFVYVALERCASTLAALVSPPEGGALDPDSPVPPPLVDVETKGPTRAGLRIMRDACAGLHALHARGIVHRDLKPQKCS